MNNKFQVFWDMMGDLLGLAADRTGYLYNDGPIALALISAEGEN